MTNEELLEEASRFITGFAHSGESGFAKRKRALQWLGHYERNLASHRIATVPKVDEDCPGCGRPMLQHTVRTPDQRTRIITCPL